MIYFMRWYEILHKKKSCTFVRKFSIKYQFIKTIFQFNFV